MPKFILSHLFAPNKMASKQKKKIILIHRQIPRANFFSAGLQVVSFKIQSADTLSAKRKQVFSLDCWIWEEAQPRASSAGVLSCGSHLEKLRITIILG
jgi:hypothetical protein